MIDPISLATLCFGASKLIYGHIQSYRDVDTAIEILISDQAELSSVLKAFHEALTEGGIIAGPGQRQWMTLQASLNDLAKALKSLEDIIKNVQGDTTGPMSRTFRTAKLEMKADDIDVLQKRIGTRVRTIQLSVQFITLWISQVVLVTVVLRCADWK